MSRRNASEYKQMDGAPAGPQPKKRRKPNANAANLNAGNNTPNMPPITNTNQNNTPPMGMPPQDLAPPPPISTFGDTIVASNPFDDTPPNVYQNGMMSHLSPHPHHAMRNDPSQYMQPPRYPNAHPMPTPPQRNMMNAQMEPGYQMSNQQPPHVPMMHPRNGSHPPMHMRGGPMPQHGNMQMNGSSALRSIHQMNSNFGLNNHMDGPMHNNRGMMMPGNGMNAGGMNAMNANTNSNMSSMNPLGQLVQMNNSPNPHLNSINSPNGTRLGSSSPSLAVNSPNIGLNGNRVPGSSSPHLGMNSPNLVPNQGARLGNSPLNNLNAMNNMNAPMGSPINQNPHVMKNNGQMVPPLNNINSLNGPIGNVHPGQQMMSQQGPLPPPRMNMANGSHGNPMNPNMMQVPPNQSPQQQMQSMHAQNMNRSNMPISPISPMLPATNSPLSSLSSMSPLSSLSSLSSIVGQPNQLLSGGSKNVQGMNPGMINPHGRNPNANMQPFQSPHHQLTPGMSPQGNTGGPPNMMRKLDQTSNFDNSMMMKSDRMPNNPNFDNGGNMNMMKGDPMSNFDNSNQIMMKNDQGMPPNMGPNHPMMNNPLINVMKQNQLPPSQCLSPHNMGLMTSNYPMQHQSMPPCNYNSPNMAANKPYITNSQNPSAPPTYKCGKCLKEINDNDEAIFCEGSCSFFYHRICVGLSEADYQRFIQHYS